MGRFFRWFLLLLLTLPAASGQNTAPPPLETQPTGPPPPPGGTNRQITLDVQVADKAGAPVRGLQKQDFTFLDDKQPKDILSFRAADNGAASIGDPPVEIVLVADAVNTSFRGVRYERGEIKKFLLRNGGKLSQPVSLVIFSDAGTKIQQGSSRDGKGLAALYDQYQTGLRSINRSQGVYGAAERFDMSVKALTSLAAYEGERPGRKLMIWFSSGWPLLSGPNIQLSRKDEQQFFNSIVAVSTALRQARITLYNIDPGGVTNAGQMRASFYEEFLKGTASPGRALPADLSLQVLAVQSGGRVFNSSNDLTAAILRCAADADSFYVISFGAARADQPDEYHAVAVTVNRPGTAARTRTGYYAQP